MISHLELTHHNYLIIFKIYQYQAEEVHRESIQGVYLVPNTDLVFKEQYQNQMLLIVEDHQ